MKMKRVVSGIQPSGVLHIGNYFGAVKNWVKMSEDVNKECYFFIADNHSSTVKFSSQELKETITSKNILNSENSLESSSNNNDINIKEGLTNKYDTPIAGSRASVIQTAACLLACGINPKKVSLFTQSNIPAHSELMWILSCMTPLSWLNKMIQFKEKSKNKEKDMSSSGLYTYPILMAADILIYKAEEVPVGEDQIQHIELTRDIALRLNKLTKKEVVPLPDYIVNYGKVMSLQNGAIKMSKSDKNTHACLSLITNEEEIKSKITKAKTDSLGQISYDIKTRPEVSNLLAIYSQCEGISIAESVKKFEQASTYEFKVELIKSLTNTLLPISHKATTLINKEFDYVTDVLQEGKKSAIKQSQKTLDEVKQNLDYFI